MPEPIPPLTPELRDAMARASYEAQWFKSVCNAPHLAFHPHWENLREDSCQRASHLRMAEAAHNAIATNGRPRSDGLINLACVMASAWCERPITDLGSSRDNFLMYARAAASALREWEEAEVDVA